MWYENNIRNAIWPGYIVVYVLAVINKGKNEPKNQLTKQRKGVDEWEMEMWALCSPQLEVIHSSILLTLKSPFPAKVMQQCPLISFLIVSSHLYKNMCPFVVRVKIEKTRPIRPTMRPHYDGMIAWWRDYLRVEILFDNVHFFEIILLK